MSSPCGDVFVVLHVVAVRLLDPGDFRPISQCRFELFRRAVGWLENDFHRLFSASGLQAHPEGQVTIMELLFLLNIRA